MSGDKHPPPKYIFKFLKNYSIDIIIIYSLCPISIFTTTNNNITTIIIQLLLNEYGHRMVLWCKESGGKKICN